MLDYKIHKKLVFKLSAGTILFLLPSLLAAWPGGLNISDNQKLRLVSPDRNLVRIFNWARETSLSFVGLDRDPVGPWYEAALPKREAFCIRDVCHQCIAAEILGLSRHNLNMFTKFVENISEAKDYCSYWEINRYNQPAPVDYSSDQDFWYNLNANFDLIDACYKLYQWTGNKTYIEDKAFDKFFQLTLNQYVERWQLQPDKIMDRPALMNLKPGTIKYKFARGLPSYDESQDDLTVSSDLLAMILNAFRTYSQILKLRGEEKLSGQYLKRAMQYEELLDKLWWDENSKTYFSFYKADKKVYHGGINGPLFLLWYQAVKNPDRIKSTLQELLKAPVQIEGLSYLPVLFYRYGYHQEGYEFLTRIYTNERRLYPEASSGVIEGIVRGMMGVESEASENRITTCPRLLPGTRWALVENIPVFVGLITVRQEANNQTTLINNSAKEFIWRVVFPGFSPEIKVEGKGLQAKQFSDILGNVFSYVEVKIKPKSQLTARGLAH